MTNTITGTADGETINGTDVADKIDALGGDDIVHGGLGDDEIIGGSGNDELWGENGYDKLTGGIGDDVLNGGDGVDRLYEDAGIDRLFGNAQGDFFYLSVGDGGEAVGGDGLDTLQFDLRALTQGAQVTLTNSGGVIGGNVNTMLISEFERIESSYTTNFDDVVRLQVSNTRFWSEVNIYLGGGNDQLILSSAFAGNISGDDGNDIITGSTRGDWLSGGLGADRLTGGGGNDDLYGGEGKDRIIGGVGNDRIEDGLGNDYIRGSAGNDFIKLFGGTEDVDAGTGDDHVKTSDLTRGVINGGEGVDTLSFHYVGLSSNERVTLDLTNWWTSHELTFAGAVYRGFEILGSLKDYYYANSYIGGDLTIILGFADGDTPPLFYAGLGDDIIYGGNANETVDGYGGSDVIYGEGGNDILYGNAMSDGLYGGAGSDTLYGGDHGDRLDGGIGNDSLNGDAAEDILLGQSGNDRFWGGEGRDTLTGGDGADRFIFAPGDSFGSYYRDTITDFSHSQGDRIDLNTFSFSDRVWTFIGNAEFTGADGELRYSQENTADGTMTIVQGSLSGGDILIVLQGAIDLVAADFIL